MGNVTSIVADLEAKKNVETVKQDQLQLWLMRLDKANPLRKLPNALHNELEELHKYLWSQET